MLACASIGQAHAAKLPGGADVVVKVRRPGVVDALTLDLELIRSVAALLSRSSQRVRSLDTMDLVEQFSTLRQELDYAREAKDAERFAANFAGDPYVRVPAVHHELSTAGLAVAGIDRAALAPRRPRHRPTEHRVYDDRDTAQADARRRVVSTMSTTSPTVPTRAQSRCSSPARPTQLTGCAPARTMRSRPARCASSDVPPTASTTG